MINFNYNYAFAIAVISVPFPMILYLLLIANHHSKIEPEVQELNIFVIPVKPCVYYSKSSINMTDSLC